MDIDASKISGKIELRVACQHNKKQPSTDNFLFGTGRVLTHQALPFFGTLQAVACSRYFHA